MDDPDVSIRWKMKESVRQRPSIGDIRYGIRVDLVKIEWIGMGIDYGKNSIDQGDTNGRVVASIGYPSPSMIRDRRG